MPKHVGLAISLKNCLRSKEFITILNNLGHCLSYDDVLRIDTTWASDIIERNDGYATLPTNMSMGAFTQAASDNADYQQENNSQHVTNTILYQYGNMDTQQIQRKTKQKSNRRSLSIPTIPLDEYVSVAEPLLPLEFDMLVAICFFCFFVCLFFCFVFFQNFFYPIVESAWGGSRLGYYISVLKKQLIS